MFNHGKFNTKRFNLPSAEGNDIVYRDDLASALKALVDMGQNIHLKEQQSGTISAEALVGGLVDASASSGDALSALVSLKADYIPSFSVSGVVNARVKLSADNFVYAMLSGLLKNKSALGENIYIAPDMTGIVEETAALGASFTAAQIYFDETLNCLIATEIFDTLILKVDLTIPAGGKLVIDSDNYNVLLNNANAIDKHSGAWVFLSRAVDKIEFRPKGANVAISMLYTERYL